MTLTNWSWSRFAAAPCIAAVPAFLYFHYFYLKLFTVFCQGDLIEIKEKCIDVQLRSQLSLPKQTVTSRCLSPR